VDEKDDRMHRAQDGCPGRVEADVFAVDNAGTPSEKTTTFDYLGLSGEVIDEQVAGQLQRSYQYSPWGERLSQTKHNTGGTTEDSFYGYDPHTSVETLTNTSGDTKATYGYTAYGQNDTQSFTGVDKPDPQDPTKQPYNFYRYTAKRLDPTSGTYDLGFRDYDPGLNRFLTRDLYNGALDDLDLTADPFTNNRYSFAAGNPTSMVDLTGHIPTADNPVSANPELNKTLNTTWTKERAARIAAAAREEARGDSFVQTFRVDRPWNQWNRFCLSNSNWAACNRAVQMVKSGRWTVQQGYESFFDVLRGQRKADQFSQAVQDFINSMGPYGAEIAVAAKHFHYGQLAGASSRWVREERPPRV
jgi:RHS repeat-associated protein